MSVLSWLLEEAPVVGTASSFPSLFICCGPQYQLVPTFNPMAVYCFFLAYLLKLDIVHGHPF